MRGNIGKRLCQSDLGVGQPDRRAHEQVQATEGQFAQTKRNRTHRRVADPHALGREHRPRSGAFQVVVAHDSASAEAVEAWTFGVLDLEQFEQLHLFGRRSDDAQLPALIGEQVCPRQPPREARRCGSSTASALRSRRSCRPVCRRFRQRLPRSALHARLTAVRRRMAP